MDFGSKQQKFKNKVGDLDYKWEQITGCESFKVVRNDNDGQGHLHVQVKTKEQQAIDIAE